MNTGTLSIPRASRVGLVIALLAGLAVATAYMVRPAEATQPDPLHQVTICHRTNSVTNPYVVITVDEAAVDGDNGNDKGQGDHLLEHTGPVFDPASPPPPPHNGDQWGDIIPPFYSDGITPTGYPSMNWPEGQVIFENDCNFPGEEESAEESVAGSVAESEEESEAASVPESEEESEAESAPESEAESAEQSVEGSGAESVGESGEQSVEAGVGTPAGSVSNAALNDSGQSPLPTVAFSLILLASLGGLAYANVKSVRKAS